MIEAILRADQEGCGCRPIGTSDTVYGIRGKVVVGVTQGHQDVVITPTIPNAVKQLLGAWELVNPPKPKDCFTSLFSAELAEMQDVADAWSLSSLIAMLVPKEPRARELRLADLF